MYFFLFLIIYNFHLTFISFFTNHLYFHVNYLYPLINLLFLILIIHLFYFIMPPHLLYYINLSLNSLFYSHNYSTHLSFYITHSLYSLIKIPSNSLHPISINYLSKLTLIFILPYSTLYSYQQHPSPIILFFISISQPQPYVFYPYSIYAPNNQLSHFILLHVIFPQCLIAPSLKRLTFHSTL